MSSCFVRLCYRFGPFVSSGQVDERLGRRVGVLDPMRRVGAAAAAVARDEVGRFIAHGDADGAGGDVHMLDRAGSMGRGRP